MDVLPASLAPPRPQPLPPTLGLPPGPLLGLPTLGPGLPHAGPGLGPLGPCFPRQPVVPAPGTAGPSLECVAPSKTAFNDELQWVSMGFARFINKSRLQQGEVVGALRNGFAGEMHQNCF